MEAKFEILEEKMVKNYKTETESAIAFGNVDYHDGEVEKIGGQVFENKESKQGEFIGTFNGRIENGELIYTISEMTKEQYDICWEVIATIEANILPQETSEAEETNENVEG